jgi:hypothetical protein
LSDYLKSKIESIIPEFPLKKENDLQGISRNSSKNESNQPVRVDFFAYSKERCFLIELKTDDESINQKQIDYLSKASEKTMGKILKELLDIYDPIDRDYPDSWKKYVHLLNRIKNETLLLEEKDKGSRIRPKYEVNQMANNINSKPKIIYLIPSEENISNKLKEKIDFDKILLKDIAKWIERQNVNSFDRQFAQALKEWS